MWPRFTFLVALRGRRLKQLGSAAILLAAVGCQTVIERNAPVSSKIVRLHGQARATMDGPRWWKLRSGVVLKSGAVVQTAKDSYVDVTLGDSFAPVYGPRIGRTAYEPNMRFNVLRIQPDSACKVTVVGTTTLNGTSVEQIELMLQRGKIRGGAQGLRSNTTYEVKFPTGVASVTAESRYEISVDGIVRVEEGKLTVSLPERKTVTQISAPQQFDARTGQLTPIPPPYNFVY